jgi:hypothetical protein
MNPHLPPHGRAILDGTTALGAAGEVPSIFDDGPSRRIQVGDIVGTRPDDDAARRGMCIEISDPDENGERHLTVLTHNENRERPRAWTFRLPESDFDPAKTIPGSTTARHGYAKFCYLVAAHGRYVTEDDLWVAGVADSLVRGHMRGTT